MNLYEIVIGLLFSNALAHIASVIKLKDDKTANKAGVVAFVIINAVLGMMLLQGFGWAKYLAIIFPLIGGIVLLTHIKKTGKSTWVDYIILALDASIVICMLAWMFL